MPTPAVKDPALRKEEVRLVMLMSLCFILVYCIAEALAIGETPLFFVITYFMLIKNANAIAYWLHLLLFGFGMLAILTHMTIKQYKKVKNLLGAPS